MVDERTLALPLAFAAGEGIASLTDPLMPGAPPPGSCSRSPERRR